MIFDPADTFAALPGRAAAPPAGSEKPAEGVAPEPDPAAAAIRAAFAAAHRVRTGAEFRGGAYCDGGVTRSGRKCSSIWPKAAANAAAVGATPRDFVAGVFATKTGTVRPNALLGDRAREAYRTWSTGRTERAAAELAAGLAELKRAFSARQRLLPDETDAERVAGLAHREGLSPAIRRALALRAGDDALAARLALAAAEEVAAAPDLYADALGALARRPREES